MVKINDKKKKFFPTTSIFLCHEQILLPELASLRLVVHEESGKFLGHRIIPVDALLSGHPCCMTICII